MADDVLKELENRQGPPLAVMMCGVAGSGKTTFAQRLEQLGYFRLSIDEEIWTQNGKYGIDFSPEEYEVLKREAEDKLRKLMIEKIITGHSVVIDFSFWQQAKRVLYKRLIEKAGGEWRLLYLKVPPDELRRRLAIRSKRSDANAAFPITEAILTAYLDGFEEPDGEGETVIEP